MPTVQEVIELAKKAGFEYVIIFSNNKGEIKLAMGLNGLTKTINDVITSYLKLLKYFNVNYSVEFYNVSTKEKIDFMDIPMYFSVEETGSITTRPGGYM
jgi:hypothetical protein